MENETEQLIARFKALADPARLRMVALCAQGECSVSELTDVLGHSQPRVSQHLKQLCAAGLLERFRDGHFVYYRVATRGDGAALRRRLLSLIPDGDPVFRRDSDKIRALRGARTVTAADATTHDRPLHRALVALTVAESLGDLVDIGCGQGRILKLLATRARRAVGVDIDSDARRFARAELLLAGLRNCSLRQGDMYSLPFAEHEFDTAILDDVLSDAGRPTDAIAEAVRILRPGGPACWYCCRSLRRTCSTCRRDWPGGAPKPACGSRLRAPFRRRSRNGCSPLPQNRMRRPPLPDVLP